MSNAITSEIHAAAIPEEDIGPSPVVDKLPVALPPASPSNPDGLRSGTLTEMQLNLLEAMAKSPHQTLFQADIIAAGGYGKHATRQCLQQLEHVGLVHRPQGERKGHAVTERGKEFLARHQRPDDQ